MGSGRNYGGGRRCGFARIRDVLTFAFIDGSLIRGPHVKRQSIPAHRSWFFIFKFVTSCRSRFYASGFSLIWCRNETAPVTHQVQDHDHTNRRDPCPLSRAQKTVGSLPCPLTGGLCRLHFYGLRLASSQTLAGSWPRRFRLKQRVQEAAIHSGWLFQTHRELASCT